MTNLAKPTNRTSREVSERLRTLTTASTPSTTSNARIAAGASTRRQSRISNTARAKFGYRSGARDEDTGDCDTEGVEGAEVPLAKEDRGERHSAKISRRV